MIVNGQDLTALRAWKLSALPVGQPDFNPFSFEGKIDVLDLPGRTNPQQPTIQFLHVHGSIPWFEPFYWNLHPQKFRKNLH